MKYLILCIAGLCITGSIFHGISSSEKHELVKMEVGEMEMRGVCWEASRQPIDSQHIQSLLDHHINWISQTPFGWQSGHDHPEIAFHSNSGMWGERDEGLVYTAKLARATGVKTLLKPHIWLTRANGKWRSDIEMNSPEEWKRWFEQYESFILHHAKLAETNGFEGLCIGTELYIASSQHEQAWRNIIAKIREVYSGKLTYAANFYKEYEEIKFWDALDFIGIQAYFPLTDKDNPSLKELRKGWQPYVKKIEALHKKWQKDIVFTEVGYRSSKDAAIRPWEWEARGASVEEEKISASTQALCYEAMFQSFWDKKWMKGFFLWKWTPENYAPEFLVNRRRQPSPLSFTPKAEGLKVIDSWYKR